MKKLKTKPKLVTVPTASKSKKTKSLTQKTVKPHSTRSKTDTLAYYNCLIDQVANPLNEKVKITQLSHHCKCNKGKAAQIQQAEKKWLIQQLAQSYKSFGESLGRYLHADIVGCAKELKK